MPDTAELARALQALPPQSSETLTEAVHRLNLKYQTGISDTLILKVISCESAMYGKAINVNSNGTTDHGFLQVNSIHIPEMNRLHLDILKSDDSLIYGFILMQKSGLDPWSASRKCWQ